MMGVSFGGSSRGEVRKKRIKSKVPKNMMRLQALVVHHKAMGHTSLLYFSIREIVQNYVMSCDL